MSAVLVDTSVWIDHLAHDEPLRPTERLERAELAHALPDRRECQEHRKQERGDRGEDGELISGYARLSVNLHFADHADALEASCSDLVGQPIRKLSTGANATPTAAASIRRGDCA